MISEKILCNFFMMLKYLIRFYCLTIVYCMSNKMF